MTLWSLCYHLFVAGWTLTGVTYAYLLVGMLFQPGLELGFRIASILVLTTALCLANALAIVILTTVFA